MVKVNNKEFDWGDGLTVEAFLKKLRDSGEFVAIIDADPFVTINKKQIFPEDYKDKCIQSGDDIGLLPQIWGG